MNPPRRKRSEAHKTTTGSAVVDELSRELDDALTGHKLPPTPRPSAPAAAEEPPLFDSPNAPGKPQLAKDFGAIVERVFAVDALGQYERLEKALTIGEQRADYGTVLRALDQAEDNARTAHRLYVGAKVERERYLMDAAVVTGAMWSKATDALQREKADGLRNKQITDGDVRAMAATLFPDQWRENELGVVKVKAMEEHLLRLADLWASRCRSLQVVLSTLRK